MTRARTIAAPQDATYQLAMLVLLTAIIMLCSTQAFAQAATDFKGVQKNIGRNLINLPRFIALLSYVAGTFFTISGLLKMKDWMKDSERNPFNGWVIRLVVATLLILLPYSLNLVNLTLFQRDDGMANVTQDFNVNAPNMQRFEKSK